ncbi:hypothetical protein ACFQ0B_73345 [Nonomuraea thailandensis]
MTRLLGRLGGWCARHGWIVLVTWVIAAAALMGGSLAFPSPTNSDASIPGTDAQRAHDLMKEGFGAGYATGGTVQLLLYSADGPLIEDERKQAVERAMDRLRTMPHVTKVETPFRAGGISSNLQIGLITVRMEGNDSDKIAQTTQELSKAAQRRGRPGSKWCPPTARPPPTRRSRRGRARSSASSARCSCSCSPSARSSPPPSPSSPR